MYEDEIDADGWTSTPADAGAIFGNKSYLNEPGPLSINEIEFPSYNELVSKCVEYVKSCLHPETFNHSMRVYYIGERVNILERLTLQSCSQSIRRHGHHQAAISRAICHT